ncbi:MULTISPECIES: mechanosensitive ion channel family protein [unclassified Rhizobium]|uniref:cyclic nucleotide-binding domain-containing protein n=1 Tax=unclassified Rhizobium TaxID=2613769 RepID=UPI000EA92BD4|nr:MULTISPECIES: mechanosensitive ion channel family protein [unclassified Rhizobium]AYG67987.1 mechanosensitive ion channel protein [Rhizobium sp. CCGE531]AYG74377.1 mechanosensitive ion channel protein [Rhizobium sp. CCGE532]
MQYLFDPITQFLLLVAIVAGAHWLLPKHRAVRFAIDVAFFVTLTAILLANGVAPYSETLISSDFWHRLFYGLAKTIWWLGGAMMLVSSIRLFLIFERRPREARFVQDLIAGIIYVGAALSVVAYVFSVPVGTLIATSGVFAIVLGLALQSTLSDVFSGIALNLGRSYSVGNWIILESGIQGRVIETNWRATHLSNATNDLVVIPNSALAKAQLVNLNSPDETHGIAMTIKLAPTRTPATMARLLETVTLGSNHMMRIPDPLVSIVSLTKEVIEFELAFRIRDISETTAAKNEIYDLVYRHALAAGIPLASSAVFSTALTQETVTGIEEGSENPLRLMAMMPLFSALTEKERETLSKSATRRTYAKGTEIIAQGERSQALALVESGVVNVVRQENGRDTELNRLSPGDFFGERGLLIGAEEPGSIIALTPAVVCEIGRDQLCEILRERPALAEDIGTTLAGRLEQEKHLQGIGGTPSQHVQTLANRIRHLFQLPYAAV